MSIDTKFDAFYFTNKVRVCNLLFTCSIELKNYSPLITTVFIEQLLALPGWRNIHIP